MIGAAGKAVVYQWGSAETVPLPRVLVSHHGPGPGASGRCQNGRTVSPAA